MKLKGVSADLNLSDTPFILSHFLISIHLNVLPFFISGQSHLINFWIPVLVARLPNDA